MDRDSAQKALRRSLILQTFMRRRHKGKGVRLDHLTQKMLRQEIDRALMDDVIEAAGPDTLDPLTNDTATVYNSSYAQERYPTK